MEQGQSPSETAMTAWRAFLTAHARLSEKLEQELQTQVGMPLTWYDVLVQLTEAPDRQLRMHELASRVLLSRAGLTRLVDRMTAAGLVERVPCPDDRRGTFVALTPEGRRANIDAAPYHLAGIQEHFGRHLSDEECGVMATAFNHILSALEGCRGK